MNTTRTQILIAAALAFALVGCSTPTRVDKGPINARTFSFVNSSASREVGFGDRREALHRMIHDAIAQDLAAKGVNQVASGGDVVVAYLIFTGNNASTTMDNEYFGYGRGAADLHDKAQNAYTSSKNPNYFVAGTLLIDIIDAKSYKLLSRSYVVRGLLSNPSAEARAEHIQEAVDAALKELRIAR
jgi:hypothetical protein